VVRKHLLPHQDALCFIELLYDFKLQVDHDDHNVEAYIAASVYDKHIFEVYIASGIHNKHDCFQIAISLLVQYYNIKVATGLLFQLNYLKQIYIQDAVGILV